MEPTSFTIISIIVVVIFAVLGIIVKETPAKIVAFVGILIMLVFFPMKGERTVLYEYDFAQFKTHGVIEYISPFDSTLIIKDITTIEIYNKLSEDEALLLIGHYNIFGTKVMETFIRD